MDKYSFVCGEGTQFDQQTLTCNFPEDAFPCEESPSLYGAVEFGKIPEDYQNLNNQLNCQFAIWLQDNFVKNELVSQTELDMDKRLP